MEILRDRVHAACVDRLDGMIVRKLPLFSAFEIADLTAGASELISRRKSSAVFGLPCIGGQKPFAADGTLPRCMTDTQSLKQIGTEHSNKRNVVHTLHKLRYAFLRHDSGHILNRGIG